MSDKSLLGTVGRAVIANGEVYSLARDIAAENQMLVSFLRELIRETHISGDHDSDACRSAEAYLRGKS